ncbi:MAG: hypothetical protein WC829_21800 [Hyphomicrobium sp.]|jgi:hypothetical protein
MKFLTPSQILKQASGARRLTSAEEAEGLFDTQAFIRLADELYGMKPVMAVQGTPHKDARAGELSQSKHLIGVAKPGGATILLLNSHTPRRRTWIANGFVRQREDKTYALIGAAVPVQRWRGIGQALEELARHHHEVNRARQAMRDYEVTGVDIHLVVGKALKRAFMPGHKAADCCVLENIAPGGGVTMFDTAFAIVKALQEPGLKIEGTGRRMKPRVGPDALFYAGNAIFEIALRRLDKYAEPIGRSLPTFCKR